MGHTSSPAGKRSTREADGGAYLVAPRLVDREIHRIVLTLANLPVSLPRGRGRRVVTLYEALVRRLASGRVPGRASIVDFLRLVQTVVAASPTDNPDAAPAAVRSLREGLEQMRSKVETSGGYLDQTVGQISRRALDAFERGSNVDR